MRKFVKVMAEKNCRARIKPKKYKRANMLIVLELYRDVVRYSKSGIFSTKLLKKK